jgi:photosystem II stability/assembly factor-like uncharacterized protein
MPVVALLGMSPFCVCRAQWEPQQSGTRARLREVSAVSSQVAWASGARGSVLRTVDGGATWQSLTVPGAGELDFRDVHALDDRTAHVLSIGAGELSRIYQTIDAGGTWTLSFRNDDPKGFLDAISFWKSGGGLAQGDPIDGKFLILATNDSARSWSRVKASGIPPALPGEGAFAASGTCLVVQGDRKAWFGTGGAAVARVFRSTDRGRAWSAHETPIMAGSPSAGIFSITFRDDRHGVAVGGDYRQPEKTVRTLALTSDGGQTWRLPMGSPPFGFRSAAVYVPGSLPPALVAVGPTGSDLSTDDGETWRSLGATGFHAVAFAGPQSGWAVGDDGVIARFTGDFVSGR